MEFTPTPEKPLQEIFDALPLRSDPESSDFQAVDTETAARLAELIEVVKEAGGADSGNFDSDTAKYRELWRANTHEGNDGTTVVNLNTWDRPGQEYRGMRKGVQRRTTVHLRPDKTFTYWGEMDWEAAPLSQSSAEALIKLFS